MKKSQVYFIMYIVLITELLVVITERDELHEKEEQVKFKMVKSIADQYKHNLILQIPASLTTQKLGDTAKVVMTPIGLVSEEEKKDVEFFIRPTNGSGPAGWTGGDLTHLSDNPNYKIVKMDDGSATFIVNKSMNIGDFGFVAYCKVQRKFPSYLPGFLLDELTKEVGNLKEAKSKPETFTIRVTTTKAVDYARPQAEF